MTGAVRLRCARLLQREWEGDWTARAQRVTASGAH